MINIPENAFYHEFSGIIHQVIIETSNLGKFKRTKMILNEDDVDSILYYLQVDDANVTFEDGQRIHVLARSIGKGLFSITKVYDTHKKENKKVKKRRKLKKT